MTHLLASLLTGVTSTLPSGSSPHGASGADSGSGPGFEELLQEHGSDNRPAGRESVQGARAENEPAQDGTHSSETQDRPMADQAGGDQKGLTHGSPSGVTMLGATFGARSRIPALTFMLPAGSGPEDMAAAIRTQVLRFTAVRNLDPGSLDNLRIAISSREMGQVEVDLSARGDKLEVDIVATGRETEAILRKTSGDLKEGLLARTDRFRQVDVKISTRDAQDEDSPDRQPRREPEQNHDQPSRQGAEQLPDPDSDAMEDPS